MVNRFLKVFEIVEYNSYGVTFYRIAAYDDNAEEESDICLPRAKALGGCARRPVAGLGVPPNEMISCSELSNVSVQSSISCSNLKLGT